MVNYALIVAAALAGIVLFDDNPTSVSMQEWILFAVMIYAAASFMRPCSGRSNVVLKPKARDCAVMDSNWRYWETSTSLNRITGSMSV